MYEDNIHTVLGDVRAGKRSIHDLPKEQKFPIAIAIVNETAKAEGGPIAPMLRRVAHLGVDFAARVAGGNVRFAETTKGFITKLVASGTRVVFVKQGSNEVEGVRSVSFNGLPKDKPFFVRAIRLRQVTSSGTVTAGDDTTLSEASGLDFDYIDKVLSTASLTIKVGNTELVSKLGCSVFNNKNNSTVNPGHYDLGNPFWIEDNKTFEMFIDFGASLPAKTFVWCELIGFDTYEKGDR